MDNINLFLWIHSLNGLNSVLDSFMKIGAEPLLYIMILQILILGWKGEIKDKKAFLIIVLAMPVAILLIKVIHLFIFEQRPFVAFHFTPLVNEATDASFPSRHATISSVIAFSYAYFKSKWSLFLLFLMLWIGVSRVYVGVHYPLDILGGFAVAAFSLIIALQIKKFLKRYLFI